MRIYRDPDGHEDLVMCPDGTLVDSGTQHFHEQLDGVMIPELPYREMQGFNVDVRLRAIMLYFSGHWQGGMPHWVKAETNVDC